MDNRGSILGGRGSSLRHRAGVDHEAHSASYQHLFPPGAKWLGRETNYTSPSSVEVRIHGAVPSPPIRLHGVLVN